MHKQKENMNKVWNLVDGNTISVDKCKLRVLITIHIGTS